MEGRPGDVAARVSWTLAEAAAWLDPPIAELRLRQVVAALAIEPLPVRTPQDRRGRPVKRYDVGEIIRLHKALLPWLLR